MSHHNLDDSFDVKEAAMMNRPEMVNDIYLNPFSWEDSYSMLFAYSSLNLYGTAMP
jgi:hypothetical protein